MERTAQLPSICLFGSMVEDKDPQNLWSTLLKESSKRFKAPEATCIFLGDTDIGKSTLLNKIGGSTVEPDANGRMIKDIISYAFIDVDEGILDSESVSRINLWSISNKTFEGCIENVVRPGKSERVGLLLYKKHHRRKNTRSLFRHHVLLISI